VISCRTEDHKAIAAAFFALWVLTGFVISQDTLFAPDPLDPDAYDMSVWKSVKPGIYSGFGSLDVSYSKSIPPMGPIAKSIKLHGWKCERVSCLLLVWSALNKDNVTIQASELSNDNFKIGKERISISALKYVLVDEFNGCGANDLAPARSAISRISGSACGTISERGREAS